MNMPRGVYPRTPNQLKAAKENLAKGRLPEARAKAQETMRVWVISPGWRMRVSKATTAAMHRPEVRERHLAGLQKALNLHGVNFKGGNGQEPVKTVMELASLLEPMGFTRELVIKTKGHGTGLTPPNSYKADFGNPEMMMVIEVDGPSHRPHKS